ncbi:MAG: hypothetical protein GDA56_27375 [Hormoscilla sp. GM7CHS1pb]|nr:hypothetical protein [Hormoscilla sp. GM7CHS1pb]
MSISMTQKPGMRGGGRFLFTHPVVRQQATTWVGEEETKVSGNDRSVG